MLRQHWLGRQAKARLTIILAIKMAPLLLCLGIFLILLLCCPLVTLQIPEAASAKTLIRLTAAPPIPTAPSVSPQAFFLL
jgi:hypothetical protein